MSAPYPTLSGAVTTTSRYAIVNSNTLRVVDIISWDGGGGWDVGSTQLLKIALVDGEQCQLYWLYDNLVLPGFPNRFYSDGTSYERSISNPITVVPGSFGIAGDPPDPYGGYYYKFPDGTTQNSAVYKEQTTTFTALQQFTAGISSGQIIAVEGVDGAGLVSVKALSGGNTRIGGIRLAYTTTPNYNTFLENSSGTFTIYNGFSATGSNLLNINSTRMAVNVPVSGMTFTGNIYAPNVVNTFNGLTGNVTGVSSVNGLTGAVSITYAAASTITSSNTASTTYPVLALGSGNTGLYIDDVTTPLSYVPSTGALTAKSFNTTAVAGQSIAVSATSVTVNDTATLNTVILDTTGVAAGNALNLYSDTQVIVSSPIGVQFIDPVSIAYQYTFPTSNGNTGQVLTTNGAGTLSWSTVTSSGGGSGFTYTSSAPGTPSLGDRWMDSDTGKEYVYVNDGSSSQWIEPVSSNGLVGVTYTSSIQLLEFGITGSFVKLGVGTTAPNYPLDINGTSNFRSGISAAGITVNGNTTITGSLNGAGATFTGAVISDGGYRISSSAINAQTGTTYTLLTSDNGKIITMNNGSSSTVTIPSGLPVGYNTTVVQLGTGSVGFTSSGTTINSAEGKLNLAFRYSAANIISYTSNTFVVAGGMTG